MADGDRASRRARALLGLGAAAGLVAALWSALGAPVPDPASRDPAAVVNGRVIPRAEYVRAVEAIRTDKDGAVTEEDRRRALDTLIREELLVQRAEEIDLLRDDRALRKAAVQAMLRMIGAQARAEVPDDATLRTFYREHPELGRADARLHVDAVSVASAAEAREIAERISSGTPFPKAAPQASPVPTPDGPIPYAKLSDYLGGRLARAALGLEEGEIAGPVAADGRHYLLWLRSRENASRPSFEAMRETVEQAWRRQREERAVRRYLERLREDASIEIAEGVPEPAS